MAKPDLSRIDEQMKSGQPFSLTDAQYRKSTGLDIPKNQSYLLHRSAVAKLAEKSGYKLVVQERTISFEKI